MLSDISFNADFFSLFQETFTYTQNGNETLACEAEIRVQLECGPMPNVMAALANTGGDLCSMPQSLADAHYYSAMQ